MRRFFAFFASLCFFVSSAASLSGCIVAEGWPPGHTCDQEEPIKFSGMLSMGIPNDDGTFSVLISPCSEQDYDDDGIPAGGDMDDSVNEYDNDLEGEDIGWTESCRASPSDVPNSYDSTRYNDPQYWGAEYQYTWGCANYWYSRLQTACAAWSAGEPLGNDDGILTDEDYQYEQDAYIAYCWYAENEDNEYPPDW